jgi:predicted dehydrogenase
MLDIGCYLITLSRWLFNAEPLDVTGQLDHDPDLGIDRLGSALLRFPNGQAAFTCAGQLAPHQRMQIHGTTSRIDVEIPFNAPPDRACRILIDDGTRFAAGSAEVIEFPATDQYTLQADRFSDAIRGRGDVPVSIEDAIANMAVIDAIFRAAESRRWEPLT